jgi:hypothetical protein
MKTRVRPDLDSCVAIASRDTLADLKAWAAALWKGEEPDLTPLVDRLAGVLSVGVIAGTVEEDRIERHAEDPVFVEAVAAMMRKAPTIAVLTPKSLTERMRQTAFYVSGVLSVNVLEKLRAALVRARIEGKSRDWFMQEAAKVADLSAAHVETVFRTNAMSAAGAGRWRQYSDPDSASDYPAFRYVSRRGHTSRPLHVAMDGFMAIRSDPIWKVIWTPNGYCCQCHVRQVRRSQAVAAGMIDSKGNVLQPRFFVNDLQRAVVSAAESGTTITVNGRPALFPDEGFRGNALMDLV